MDTDSWKRFVHSSYWDVVTCQFTDENGHTVYISTKEGAFIEFCEGVIERSCSIECDSVVAIEKFFTYIPFMKYFLLKDSDKIIIICDSVDLKVTKVYSGIENYEIGDFSEVGSPQVKVWFIDREQEPLIVNFSDLSDGARNISTNHNHDYLCGRLELKLKESKEVLAKFIKEVEDKKRLRADSMLKLVNRHSAVEVCYPPKEMKCFFGSDDADNHFPMETDGPAVKVCHQWQAVLCGKWSLGMIIRNSSKRCIGKFKVLLCELPKQRIYYSVKRLNSLEMSEVLIRLELMTPKISDARTVRWEEETVDCELTSGNGCVLICTLPFPEFSSSSKICVSGRLSYSNIEDNDTSEMYSQELPMFEITARDVLNYSPLSPELHKTLSHTLSTIALSELALLNVSVGVGPPKSSVNGLLSNIGFSPTDEDGFFLNSSPENTSLQGCAIQIVPVSEDFEMRLYARSCEILSLLVYIILEALPGSWNVRHCANQPSSSNAGANPSVTVHDCSDALSKEIDCIIYHTSKWKKMQPSSKLSADMKSYSRFKKELSTLQNKTDVIFSKYELGTD